MGLVTARLSEDARRLHRLAATDDLTGLHNLRSFELRLAGFVRRWRIDGGPLSMLVLDVDRLKALNEAHGHLAGAEAVRTVGHVLAADDTAAGEALFNAADRALYLAKTSGRNRVAVAERISGG